jgi:hypothetical protein
LVTRRGRGNAIVPAIVPANGPANGPDSDLLTYRLLGGSGATAFDLDAQSGTITVADSTLLDRGTPVSVEPRHMLAVAHLALQWILRQNRRFLRPSSSLERI